MKINILLVVLGIGFASPAIAQTAPMVCTTGPITKVFGGSKWTVNSCADDLTVLLMAVEGSPAAPCFIVVAPEATGYSMDGRGKGDRQAIQAAMHELRALSKADIQALIAETKQQKN